jgi:hypothetical protein
MSRYQGNEFAFISPQELKLPNGMFVRMALIMKLLGVDIDAQCRYY